MIRIQIFVIVNYFKTTENQQYITTDQSDLISISSNVFNPKKQVSFCPIVEQRNFQIDSDHETSHYNDIQKYDRYENNQMENINNISFDSQAYKFVIEDTFFRMDYKLPKNINQIKFFDKKISKLNNNEKKYLNIANSENIENMKNKINHALEIIKESKNAPINRIDGILFLKKNRELVILTEFFIYAYVYENNSFYLNKTIAITSIDYITLTRNGNKMILHLVNGGKNMKENHLNQNLHTYIYKEKTNLNGDSYTNFVLNYKQLEKVVGCIASTYFYDKQDFCLKKEYSNRLISVIIINENFEIIEDLEKLTNFEDYK